MTQPHIHAFVFSHSLHLHLQGLHASLLLSMRVCIHLRGLPTLPPPSPRASKLDPFSPWEDNLFLGNYFVNICIYDGCQMFLYLAPINMLSLSVTCPNLPGPAWKANFYRVQRQNHKKAIETHAICNMQQKHGLTPSACLPPTPLSVNSCKYSRCHNKPRRVKLTNLPRGVVSSCLDGCPGG